MAFLSGPMIVGPTTGGGMGPAAAMALKWGVPIASSILGGYSGKQRGLDSKNPTRTEYSNTSQIDPWDFMPNVEGNQGAELLASLLGGWEGLLGNTGVSKLYRQNVNQGLGGFLT
jgi:hypothetical protein